jgi:hypothetical protein
VNKIFLTLGIQQRLKRYKIGVVLVMRIFSKETTSAKSGEHCQDILAISRYVHIQDRSKRY